MEKWKKLLNEARKGGFSMKEFLTRSEGEELFVTVLSDKLMQGLQPELPNGVEQVYDEVALEVGRDIRFPSVRGINPDLVPENAEFQRAEWEITSVTVEPLKFGILLGLTREMLQDANLSLIGRNTQMVGAAHRDLRRREHVKCLSFYSTGPATTTGIIGLTDHGYRYPQLGYTNVSSGTGLSWEVKIHNAITMLMSQRITITAKGIDLPFPVIPDTIIAHPTHRTEIMKVLNAGITVLAAGVGGTNVAGSNVLQGMIANQIYDPELPTAQAFILQRGRGLVTVRKEGLTIDEYQSFYFDAQDIKSRERFLPAVIEERFICDLQATT